MEQRPPSAPEAAPVCAVHLDRTATGTCDRCGNFVCALCLDESSPLPGHCEACRDRQGGGVIPFEHEGGLMSRWWRTTRAMLTSPSATFSSCGVGSPWAAAGYLALTGALVGAVLSALGLCAFGALGALGGLGQLSDEFAGLGVAVMVAAVLLYPLLVIVGMLLSAGFRTLLYHLPVALSDGQGGLGSSWWAVCYLHAVQVLVLPIVIVQQIPLIGPFIGLLCYGGIEVYYALALTTAAKRFHALQGRRAALAGWFPFIVVALLMISCCLIGFFVALLPLMQSGQGL